MNEEYSLETIECVKCGKEFETLWKISEGMPDEIYCDECIKNFLDHDKINTLRELGER